MNEQSAFQEQPAYVQKTSNKKRLLVIFFVVLVLLIIGLVGLYFLGGSAKRQMQPTAPIPTTAPPPVATATPEASTSAKPTLTLTATPSAMTKLDRTTIAVSVQNGSGTAGVAQKYATILKNAGYTKVSTANADNFTYTGITIHVTKKYSTYLPLLQKDIAAADPKAKITATVDNTIASDAEVIVGE